MSDLLLCAQSTSQDFLRRVGDHLVVSQQESERLARAALEAVRMWLSARDVREIAVQRPDDLRDLWGTAASGLRGRRGTTKNPRLSSRMIARGADLGHRLGFDLADPFTRHREVASNLLECELAIETQSVSKTEHHPLALVQ